MTVYMVSLPFLLLTLPQASLLQDAAMDSFGPLLGRQLAQGLKNGHIKRKDDDNHNVARGLIFESFPHSLFILYPSSGKEELYLGWMEVYLTYLKGLIPCRLKM